MQRYPVVVCQNCGTEYNATRAVCPGFQCFEQTPKLEGVTQVKRQYRSGPVISDPAMVPAEAGGTEIAAYDVEPPLIVDDLEEEALEDEEAIEEDEDE